MDSNLQLNLAGSSSCFRQTCQQIQKIAKVDAAVLIEGETGTGKELAARAIHYLGARSDQPFFPVNCGALPESLVESELFGHERGAFTDAKTALPGLVSEADGGTLFLDEVDALSLKAQAALLRFLQDRTYRRVGGSQIRQANVRVIAATNAHLDRLVEAKQFRLDLLYRLNILSVRMPPLRERVGDAVELAHIFLARLNRQYRTEGKHLHASTIHFIEQYTWPGNVRELENVMHREYLMSDGDAIQFGYAEDRNVENGQREVLNFKTAKAQAVNHFEQNYVRDLLELADGNLSRAARLAGQDRSAFGKLVRKHGLSRGNEYMGDFNTHQPQASLLVETRKTHKVTQ